MTITPNEKTSSLAVYDLASSRASGDMYRTLPGHRVKAVIRGLYI